MKRRSSFFVLGLVSIMLLSVVANATQWYVSPTGSNTNTGLTPASPWKTIQFSNDTAAVSSGDTLNLMSGTFTELVSISKSLYVQPYNGASVTLTAPSSASNAALLSINAANVSVNGLALVVNAPNATVGVYALNRNALTLRSLSISRNGSGGSFSISSTDINTTFSNAGVVFVSDNSAPFESMTLESCTIGSSSTPFERAVWMRATTGTIGGSSGSQANNLFGSSQDLSVQYAAGSDLTIANNSFGAAGLLIDEPNVFSNTANYNLNINANTFSPSSTSFSQSLFIRHNYKSSTSVAVTNNSFSGHSTGILCAASANVSMNANSFSPGASGAQHIIINSAASGVSANYVQNSCVVNGNSFNASSFSNVRAVVLLDDNAGQSGQPTPDYSSVTIGSSSSRNTFASSLHRFVAMGNGFSLGVDASANLFGTSSGSILSSAMSLSQLFDVEDKIDHKVDVASYGFVNILNAKKFVTLNSYQSPSSTVASIQRAIDAASSGDTVFVKAGTYSESVSIGTGITLCGDQLQSNMPSSILSVNNNIALNCYGTANKSISRFEVQINSGSQGRFGIISNNTGNTGNAVFDFCSFRRGGNLVGGVALPGTVGTDVTASIDDGNDYSGTIGKYTISHILGCPETYTLSALTEFPCETDSLIVFLSSYQSGVSYALSVNGTTMQTSQSVTNDGKLRFALPSMGAGSYQMIVRGTLGSCVVTMAGSPTLTAFTPQTPALSLNSLNQVLCAGNPGQITVINSEPLATYSVLDGSTVVVSPKVGNNGSISFTLPASLFPSSGTKNFAVRASSTANQNCSASTAYGNPDGAAFTVYPLPSAPIISTPTPNACSPGGSATVIVANAEAGYTYQVVDGNTAVYSVTATTNGTFTISNIPVSPAVPGLGLGSRVVRVYAINPNNNNCRVLSTNALTITVSQRPSKPSMATGTTTQTYCEAVGGVTAQLFVANGDPSFFYRVVDSTTSQTVATATGQSGLFSIDVMGLTTAGSVYKLFVVAVNANTGCESVPSDMNYITVSPTPHPVLSLSGSSQTGSITATTCLGYANPYVLTTTTDMSSASYQWYLNNTAINGATLATYTVPTGLNLGTYTYHVRQTSSVGCVGSSNTFSLTVAQNLSVSASVQGGGTTVSFFSGTTNQINLVSSVSPSGLNPTYQWLKNGSAISGATTSGYQIPSNTTPGSYLFSVVATSNSGCSSTSNTISVTVWNPPTVHIFVQANGRNDSSYAAGVTPPVLTSTISGAQGQTPSYQWYGPNNNSLSISGATNANYTPVSSLTPGVYRYIMRATLGGLTVGSDTVTITVLAPATLHIFVVANTRNDSTFFTSLAAPQLGSTITNQNGITFSYQWYGPNSTNPISGATSALYTPPSNLAVGTYRYTAKISGGGQLVSSDTVTLTVLALPTLNAYVAPNTSKNDSTYFKSVAPPTLASQLSATNGYSVSYQWFGPNGPTTIAGATSSTYGVPAAMNPGTYTYYVRATLGGVVVGSDTLTIVVVQDPSIIAFIHPNQNQKNTSFYRLGQAPSLNSALLNSNSVTPSYQWYSAANGSALSGATNAMYALPNTLAVGTYTYYVKATFPGLTILSDTLTVQVLSNASVDIYFAANNRNDSTCFYGLTPPAIASTILNDNSTVFSYQWYGPNSSNPISGATAPVYTPQASLNPGTYDYYLIISGGGVQINSDTVRLTIAPLPVLHAFVETTVGKIDSTYFESMVPPQLNSSLSGNIGYPVSYQWFGPNSPNPISGQTNGSYDVPSNLSPGTYTYVLKATLGGVVVSSETITITILPDPTILAYISPNQSKKDTSYVSGSAPATLGSILSNSSSLTPSYQWYSADNGAAISGAKQSTYTVPSSLAIGTHRYSVEATFPGLSVASDTVQVTVLSAATVDIYVVANGRNDSTYYRTLAAPQLGSTISNGGGITYTYQWYGPNGATSISGATSSTFTPPSSLTPGTYTYFLRISGGGVVVGSDTVSIVVAPLPTLNAYVSPNTTQNDSTYFQAVTPPTLSTQLNGNLGYPVAYQWYGPNSSSPISGATNPSFGVPSNMTPGTYTYFVRATLGGVVVGSDTITITVLANPTISAYISPNTAKKDSSYFSTMNPVTLSRVLTNSSLITPSYQWYSVQSGTAISGATNASYTVPASLVVGTHSYYVRANFPGLTISSDTVRVTILSPVGLHIFVVANGRSDSTYYQGVSAPQLGSLLSGAGSLIFTYQWYGPNSSNPISGATASTYTPSNSLTPGTYTYTLKASTLGITFVSDTVTITVAPPPTANAYVSPNVNQNDSTYFRSLTPPTLSVQVAGNIGYPLSYQWYGPNNTNPISGATTANYGVPSNLSPGTYKYFVRSTLGGLTVGSDTVTIVILPNPTIAAYINPFTSKKDTTYFQSVAPATLGSLLTNNASKVPSYQWYSVSSGSAVSGATANTYTVPNTLAAGVYKYYVKATFPGLTIGSDTVTVTILPSANVDIFVVANGRNDSTYFAGLNAPQLGSTIGNSGGVTFSYQWYGPNSAVAIVGATNSTYTPPSNLAVGSNKYFLRISGGGLIIASDTVNLTVAPRPSSNAYISPNVNQNDSTYFRSVVAPMLSNQLSGNIGYTVGYQWYGPNGPSPINGATNTNYSLPNLAPGTYTYFVRSTLGGIVVSSDTLTITVLADPSLTAYIAPSTSRKDSSYFIGTASPTLSSILTNNFTRIPSYQWYSVNSGSAISGATAASYTVPSSLGLGVFKYVLRASFPGLIISSDTLTISVTSNASVDAYVVANNRNDSTYFQGLSTPPLGSTISNSGGITFTYQWFGPNSSNAISGATSAQYNPPSNLAVGSYKYYVTISGSGITIASDTVTIVVATPPTVNAYVSPKTTQNDSTYFRSMTPPTLGSQVGGNIGYPLSYQWYGPNNTNPISGATTSSYAIPGGLTPGVYKYFVRVSLGGLVVGSDTVTITILADPTISAYIAPNTSKKDSTYYQGQTPPSLASTLNNSSSISPSYQWISVEAGVLSGATTAGYTVPSNLSVGTRHYVLRASFPGLTIFSDTLTITVLGTPSVDVWIDGTNHSTSKTVCEGQVNLNLLSQIFNSSLTPTYQWYLNGSAIGAATNQTYTVSSLTAGSYQFKLVADFGGTTILSNTITITVNPLPTPQIQLQSGSTSICTGSGSTATLRSVLTHSQYQWYVNNSMISGATNRNYTVPSTLTQGTYLYSLTVVDANGCTASTTSNTSLSVSVHESPNPSITVQSGSTSYCSGATMSTVLTTQSGMSSYQWKLNGQSINGATSNSYTVSGTALSGAYLYTVVVSDIYGCTGTSSSAQSVIVSPSPSVSLSSSSVSVCSGYTSCPALTAVVSNCISTPSYQWYVDASAVNGATTASFTAPTGLSVGSHAIKVTVVCGTCSSSSSNATFTVQATPTISLSGSSQTLCSGYTTASAISATVSGCTGTPVYQWILDGNAVSGATSTTYAVPGALSVGTHSVQVQLNCGSCTTTSSSYSVIVNQTPTITLSSASSGLCEGYSTAPIISASVNGCSSAAAYQWSLNGSPILGATTSSYQVPTGLSNGTYQYQVVVSCGNCTTSSSLFTLTVNELPSVSLSTNTQTVCQGYASSSAIAATVSGCSATAAYQWSVDGVAQNGASSAVFTVPTGLTQGTHTISVVVSCGSCTAVSSSCSFIVVAQPSVSVSTTGAMSVCTAYTSGPTMNASVSGCGSTSTFQWYRNSVAISGATQSSYTIPTGLSVGSYSYSVHVACGSCSASSSAASFVVNNAPTASITPSSQTVCTGYANCQSLVAVVSGCTSSVSYQWYKNGNAISGATSALYYIPAGMSAGTYTYTVVASCGSCSVTSSSSILTVSAVPTVTISPSSQSVCVNYTSTEPLTANVSGCNGTVSYQWKRNGSAISGATNSTYTIPTGYNCGSNNYSLSVSCGGCTATSNTATLEVTNAPTIVISPASQNLCGGYTTSQTLSATVYGCSNAASYQWRKNGVAISGATQATYTVPTGLASGSYSYTVKVNCGHCSACAATSSASTVNVSGTLSVSLSCTQQSLCVGYGSGPSISASLSGCNGSSASYQWKQNGATISGATESSYTVPTGLSAGTYSYSVVVSCGSCTGTSAQTSVTVNPVPTVSITPASQAACVGYSSCTTLSSSLSGCSSASYQWYKNGTALSGATGANYSIPSGLAAGTYSYTVVASCGGCSNSSNTSTFSVNTNPSVSISPATQNLCLGYAASSTLQPAVSNCSATASYQWKLNGNVLNGATNATYSIPSNLSAGTYSYSLVVTCGGCTGSSNNASVVVSAPPSLSISPMAQTVCYGYSSTQAISASVSGCNGTPSYQWTVDGAVQSGATTSSFNVPTALGVGSHTVVATLSYGGCTVSSSSANVVVSQAPNLSISVAQGDNDLCVGYSAGCTKLVASTFTCSSTPAYQWYKNGSAISGATTSQYLIPSGLTAGSYVYSLSATCGACTVASSTTQTITVSQIGTPSIVSSVNSYCDGSNSTALLSVSGGSFQQYQWKLNGTAINGATSSSYQMPTGLSQGTYNYTVTVTNGACTTTSAAKQISVGSGVSASVACSGASICSGSSTSIVFSLTSGNSNNWTLVYSNGSQQFTVNNISTATYTLAVSPSFTTTYSIVSVSSGGCTTNGGGSTTVTVSNAPAARTIGAVDGDASSVCFGASETYTIASTTSGNTYTWSVVSSVSGITSTQLSNTQFKVNYPQNCSSGTYTVTIKLIESTPGGCSRTNTITTTVTAPPTVLNPSASASTICLGQSTTISISAPQSGVSYSLFKGSTQIGSTLSSTSTVSWSVTPTATGSQNYTVKAVNTGGCQSTMNSVSVNVIAAPTVAISTPSTTLCPGDDATVSFTFSGQGPWTLTYKIGSGSNISVNTSANPYTITQANLCSTTVFSVVSVQNATCSGTINGSASVTVSVATMPTQSFCMGFAGDDATVNSNSKVTSWDNYAGSGSNFPNGAVNTSNDACRPQKYPNYSALNGHAGIYFDGNDQPVSVSVNTGSGISSGTQKSWYMLYRPASNSMSYGRQVIYKQGDENHGFCIYVINRVIYYGMWNNQNCCGSCSNKWSVFQCTNFCVTPGNNYILQMVYNGNASGSNRLRFSINGNVYTPSATPGTSLDYSGDAASFGGKVGNTRFHDFASVNDCNKYAISCTKIAEVLLYNTSDATVRNQVWCVLKNKYGMNSLGDNPIGALSKNAAEDEFVAGEPSSHTYELSESQPNPAREMAQFNLSVDNQQHVRIVVLNEIGQEMAVVFNGMLSRGGSNAINVETNSLASGGYILRVEGEDFVTYRSFMVVH